MNPFSLIQLTTRHRPRRTRNILMDLTATNRKSLIQFMVLNRNIRLLQHPIRPFTPLNRRFTLNASYAPIYPGRPPTHPRCPFNNVKLNARATRMATRPVVPTLTAVRHHGNALLNGLIRLRYTRFLTHLMSVAIARPTVALNRTPRRRRRRLVITRRHAPTRTLTRVPRTLRLRTPVRHLPRRYARRNPQGTNSNGPHPNSSRDP